MGYSRILLIIYALIEMKFFKYIVIEVSCFFRPHPHREEHNTGMKSASVNQTPPPTKPNSSQGPIFGIVSPPSPIADTSANASTTVRRKRHATDNPNAIERSQDCNLAFVNASGTHPLHYAVQIGRVNPILSHSEQKVFCKKYAALQVFSPSRAKSCCSRFITM